MILTDMTDEEVYLALTVFFHKIVKNDFPLRDLKIMVDCPNEIVTHPKILLQSNSSFIETKQRIAKVLCKSFSIMLSADVCTQPEKFILLRKKYYENFIASLKKKAITNTQSEQL